MTDENITSQTPPCFSILISAHIPAIQVIFYDKLDGIAPIIQGTLFVVPMVRYVIKVEIQRTDTNHGKWNIIDIGINGNQFGKCNPDGGPDGHCRWYDCAPNLKDAKIVWSSNGTIDFAAKYSSASSLLGLESSKCTWDGIETFGIARVTLFPVGGNNIMFSLVTKR